MLVDRYQIERRLGSGGMGVVYAARDIHLGRAVAVKVVGPRIEPGSGQGRLMHEAQAMARFRHPNIATVYDMGVSGDRLFVVMEIIDGGTVAEWLEAKPRSWREIVGLYLQAARGLAAAHAAGFVHRDFKPENVLVGKEGVARVSDFGVARILGDSDGADPGEGAAEKGSATRTGVVVGTPGYIAPEILRHEPADERADQFSFCVALYAALHGKRPFEAIEGPGRIAETLGKRRPPQDGSAPGWLQRVVARGLAADPRDRWPTIDALTAAIERRLRRRLRALVLAGVGVAAVAATAIAMLPPPAPAPQPLWSPILLGRQNKDTAFPMMTVSPDGSTLATYSSSGAWIEPWVGSGPRRHVAFPLPGTLRLLRLSRTGDRVFGSFDVGRDGFEIWAIDVATNLVRRRVPPSGAPDLKPGLDFDVGPDGSIVFGVADGTALWRVGTTGEVGRVVTAEPGQSLRFSIWSPDGTRFAYQEGKRIKVMDSMTGAARVVSHRDCMGAEWLTENALACLPWSNRNPVVVELLLPAGAGEAKERVRYIGPEYQRWAWFYTSSTGVLFATVPSERHLGLLHLHPQGDVRRISSGGITDLPAAGWTSSGLLIFGASVQGHLRIMAMQPDGRVETVRTGTAAEVPLVVLGDTLIFGRFPGGDRTIPFSGAAAADRYVDGELFRLALPGGSPEPLGSSRGFFALACAGGRVAPCVLAERSGDDVIAVDWDPETGARGRQRARWSEVFWGNALSPDGRTLAQVQRLGSGLSELSLLDLKTGNRSPILVRKFLDYPGWQPDGTLLAMDYGDGNSSIVRVRDAEHVERVAVVDDPAVILGAFQITPDGNTAAVLVRETLKTYWWAPREQN